MKFLLTINQENYIKKASLFDGFILPVLGLSKGFDSFFSITKINEILFKIKEYGKESYLLLNDLYKDKDFLLIDELLLSVNLKLVDSFMVSDIGVLQYLKDKKLSKKVVYYPSSLITSASEFSFLTRDKIKGAVISPRTEIATISQIIKKAKIKTYLFGFGRDQLFSTITPLVTNFKNLYQLQFLKDKLSLVEKCRPNQHLPLCECVRGSTIFSSENTNFLTSDLFLKLTNLDYFIFDARYNDLEEIITYCRGAKNA